MSSGPSSDPSKPSAVRFSGYRLPLSNVASPTRVVNWEKLPCVPRRSGVDIAESSLPLNLSGGKVIGTRMMVDPMCCFPSRVQKGTLLRLISTCGPERGIRRRPNFRTRSGGYTFAVANSGT